MKNNQLPIENRTYNYFDDGKIRESRLYEAWITNIIPFNKARDWMVILLKEESESCPHLYAKDTDYFIESVLFHSDKVVAMPIFVRTVDGGWFSLGEWAGRLDVDGLLTESLNEK